MELNRTRDICILEDAWKRWKKSLTDTGMLYLYAMTGFGKTTQAVAFAQSEYKEWKRISASEDDFITQLEETFLQFNKTRVRSLIILDDLQWVTEETNRKRIFEILIDIRKKSKISLFLLSRAKVPIYLSPLQVTRQMLVEDLESLRLQKKDIEKMILSYESLAHMPEIWKDKMIEKCLLEGNGYALGTNALIQRLSQHTNDPETAIALATQDIDDYLETHLFRQWTTSRKEAAIHLAVCQEINKEMAQALLGGDTVEILNDFLNVGSFLNYRAPDTYWITPFFSKFLEKQLMKRPETEWLPLYETAAVCYEKQRDFPQALRCYKKAMRQDKIVDLIVYLSENAEGCEFARIAQSYIEDIPQEWEKRNPQLLGAKVMLSAYRMQIEDCAVYLERLKHMAEEEKKTTMGGGALAVYVRTVIACPYDTADKLKDNMIHFVNYARQNGFHVNNIMPTGNMPSIINGGLDLLSWMNNKKILYPIIKAAAELLMGKEAVGIADASYGEALYEQNQSSKAMSYLTRALSAANYNGSIRVQYTVTAIMARLFQAEGQWETADEILHNLLQRIEKEKFQELLPNVHASVVCCSLLKQDMFTIEEWLNQYAPNEHEEFYINSRYQLFIKARVYTTYGKTMEALYILNLLENFAILYERTYFQIEVLILKAIVFYRREELWQESLLSAVALASKYGLVRVFADQGTALYPLWKQIDWEAPDLFDSAVKINIKTIKLITKEMKQMASRYPNYMKLPQKHESLSKKETEVLSLMANGYNNTKIAEVLGINLGTAKFHVGNIMRKLEAENRTVAVKIAQKEGLL